MIRLEMNRKQEAILAAIIIAAALAAFVLYSGTGRPAQPEAAPEPAPVPLFDTISAYMNHQRDLEKDYNLKYSAGDYTLDSPLVIADPYSAAPLTALVRFETEEPSEITVYIKGKTDDVSVTYTFGGYETDHTIPILGLYPDMVNIAEITAKPQGAGDAVTTTLLIETGPVPDIFTDNNILKYSVQQKDTTDNENIIQYATGLYSISAGEHELPVQITRDNITGPPFYFTFMKKSAFDTNGDYRWVYSGIGTSYATKYTDGGIFHIIAGSIEAGDALLLEIDMLGKVISAVPVDKSFKTDGYFGANSTLRREMYK